MSSLNIFVAKFRHELNCFRVEALLIYIYHCNVPGLRNIEPK